MKATTLKVGSTGAAVKVLQRALGGMVVDGTYRSATAAAVKAFQTAHHADRPRAWSTPKTWAALELKVHPLLPYWGTVLKSGSKGAAVVALQKALRIKADGTYGADHRHRGQGAAEGRQADPDRRRRHGHLEGRRGPDAALTPASPAVSAVPGRSGSAVRTHGQEGAVSRGR